MPLPKNILPSLEDIEPKQEDTVESYEEDDEFLEDLSDEDFGNFDDDDIVDFGDMIEDDEYSQMIKEQDSEEESSHTEEQANEDLPNEPKEKPVEKPQVVQNILNNKPKDKKKKLKGSSGGSPLDILKKYKTPVIVLSSVLVAVLILFIVMSFLKKDKPVAEDPHSGSEPSSVESAVEIGGSDDVTDKDYYIKEGKLVVKPKSDSKKFEYIEAAVLTEDGITRCVSFEVKLNEKHEPTVLGDCDIDLSGRTIENIIIYEKD